MVLCRAVRTADYEETHCILLVGLLPLERKCIFKELSVFRRNASYDDAGALSTASASQLAQLLLNQATTVFEISSTYNMQAKQVQQMETAQFQDLAWHTLPNVSAMSEY